MKQFKLAICQNMPGFDKIQNVARAQQMVRQAAAAGAELIMLPEMFYFVYELKRLRDIAEQHGETLSVLRQTARELGVYLCTGSMAEQEKDNIFNRAYLLDPAGDVILTYSKSYMFDVNLPGLMVQESAVFSPGGSFAIASTTLGNIGMLICFDIRFPETTRELVKRGVEIILVPAAFNTITGPAHWHMTFRTRAVESQCFVAAASPARNKHSTYHAYGHSLVVDPWGKVLTEAGTGEGIVYCTLDPRVLTDTRARLPLLKNIGL